MSALNQLPSKVLTPFGKIMVGYCEGIRSGTVRVGVAVDDCPGFGKGFDAYTGHKSVTRIMIEEVPKPQ